MRKFPVDAFSCPFARTGISNLLVSLSVQSAYSVIIPTIRCRPSFLMYILSMLDSISLNFMFYDRSSGFLAIC